MEFRFSNRREAGRILGELFTQRGVLSDAVVLGLPRGGVPVAYEVSKALDAPLDVFLVRKLGVPWQPEYAMGAIASGGLFWLNEQVVRDLGIDREQIEHVLEEERMELHRREKIYRDPSERLLLAGKTIVLVDDGLATGSTMRAAVGAIAKENPGKVMVAIPVAAPDICEELRSEVNEVICAYTPSVFHAVGEWYEDFEQTSDEEVVDLLRRRPGRKTSFA